MTEAIDHPSNFAYEASASTTGPGALLNLLQTYRDAEASLRARVAGTLRVGDTELVALRFLLQAEQAGRHLRSVDLGSLLGLTTSSVTALVDRLEAAGYVSRVPNPTDRRSAHVRLDGASTAAVRAAIDSMQSSILTVATTLPDSDRRVVTRFLQGVIDATQASNEPPTSV